MSEPIIIFSVAYLTSALCGIAVVLRSEVELSLRLLVAVFLYNGLLGLSISLLVFEFANNRAWFTIGLSMLCGLAGIQATDLAAAVLKRLRIVIRQSLTTLANEDEPRDDA